MLFLKNNSVKTESRGLMHTLLLRTCRTLDYRLLEGWCIIFFFTIVNFDPLIQGKYLMGFSDYNWDYISFDSCLVLGAEV